MILRQSVILDNKDVFSIIKKVLMEKGFDVANLTWDFDSDGHLISVQVNLCDETADLKI